MDLVELTKEIVTALAKDKDSVNVKEFETDEENTIKIEVLISSDDMGRVIGKDGKIINSIRTVVQAASSLTEENKRVRINVDSY